MKLLHKLRARRSRGTATPPPGFHGINVVNEYPHEGAPEPVMGGLPPSAAAMIEAAMADTLVGTVQAVKLASGTRIDWPVRVHVNPEGVQYVDVETPIALMRVLLPGSAAEAFCDGYEAALRRAVAHAIEHGQQTR